MGKEDIKTRLKKANWKFIGIGAGIFTAIALAPAIFKFEYNKTLVNIVAAIIIVAAGYWIYKVINAKRKNKED